MYGIGHSIDTRIVRRRRREMRIGRAHGGTARCLFGPYVFDPALAQGVAQHSPAADVVVLVREQTLQYSPEARAAGAVVADMNAFECGNSATDALVGGSLISGVPGSADEGVGGTQMRLSEAGDQS